MHILFLVIWAVGVLVLWKNGPAKAGPLGAALGVFFLVWGVGGCGAGSILLFGRLKGPARFFSLCRGKKTHFA